MVSQDMSKTMESQGSMSFQTSLSQLGGMHERANSLDSSLDGWGDIGVRQSYGRRPGPLAIVQRYAL